MKERGLLVAGARLIGLWMLTYAVTDLRMLLEYLAGLDAPRINYFPRIIEYTAVGFVLLVWAHRLADWVCCLPGLRPAAPKERPPLDLPPSE